MRFPGSKLAAGRITPVVRTKDNFAILTSDANESDTMLLQKECKERGEVRRMFYGTNQSVSRSMCAHLSARNNERVLVGIEFIHCPGLKDVWTRETSTALPLVVPTP